jgi:hypothetical protein
MNHMNMADHLNELGALAAGQHGGVLARILDHPDAGGAATATVSPAAPTVVPIAPAPPDWVAWTVIAALAFAAVTVAISALLLLSSSVVRALAASVTSMREQSRTLPIAGLIAGLDVGLDAELDRDLCADLDLVENGR